MYKQKTIIVVMPAYNAGKTLESTYYEIPKDIVDEIILVDDCSSDDTVKIAQEIGLKQIIRHDVNKGYGGNQKTCYDKAIELGADIVVMLHPDYQYTPKLIPQMVDIIESGKYSVVLGSRIIGNTALKGGMPFYKYIANRFLTWIQNVFLNQKLSEYHTGYRAFDVHVLKSTAYHYNSNDFIFDNQILSQIIMQGYSIGEVSCPAKYFKEASTINFKRSIIYGIGVIWVSLMHFLHKHHLFHFSLYQKK